MSAVSPKVVYAGPADALPKRKLRAEDSKTWTKGDFCILSSGTVTPLTTTGSTAVYGIFAETQATNTSSTDVWVHVLEENSELEIYVANNGSSSAIGQSNVGVAYGLELGDGTNAAAVAHLDLGTTSGQFEVIRLSADYEPEKNAAADSPGKCIVRFNGYVS